MGAITRLAIVAILSAAGLAIAPGLAGGSQATESRGAELLEAIERNEATCGEPSEDDLIAIGELAMGRMLGGPPARRTKHARLREDEPAADDRRPRHPVWDD